jgi:succinate dehydrogenase/fumarate reductase flavoprotein subunit
VARWSVETEVIVVGFGAAGASVAIEAARAGANVTLCEATSGNGGTSALSGGEIYLGGGGGTPIQRAAGFDDRTEDLYKYLLMAGGPNVDEAKVRLYADGSLAHYEWLTAQGVEYRNSYIAERTIEPSTDDCLIWSGSEEAWPFVNEARPAPRGHCPKFVGMGGGRYVMDVLARRVVELGVDVRYDHRALALVTDDAHRVHGLILRAGGETLFARARKGVVLCTGGFVMNREMVRRHAPWMLRSNFPIGTVDDGSGIRLGVSAGGAAINMAEGFRHAALVSARLAGQGNIRQRARPALRKRGLLSRARVAVHPAATRQSHLAAGRCRVVSANGVPGAFARRDRRGWRDLGGSGARPWAARALARRDRRALQPQRRAWRGSTLSQGKTLAGAAREAAVRRARLPHRSLLLFELHPGRSRHLAYGRSAHRGSLVVSGLYAAGRTACGLPRWGGGYSSGMSLADATFFGRQAGAQAARA